MKLSDPMVKMLRCVDAGEDCTAYCRGRSEFGGAEQVLRALLRRGLLLWRNREITITPAGKKAIEK